MKLKNLDSFINEAVTEKSVQKLVDEVNELIKKAVDSDGDPIGVEDHTSTHGQPYVYDAIVYDKKKLTIKYRKDDDKKYITDVIKEKDMENDGIPALKHIKKMYVKGIK